MTWHEMSKRRQEARKANRVGWKRGHARRSQGWAVLEDKKSGGIVAQAKNGCFGNLRGKGKDAEELYQAWAEGTAGAS